MFFGSSKSSLTKLKILTREGIPFPQLPAGGIGLVSEGAPDPGTQSIMSDSKWTVEQFIREILTEGVPFVDGVAPKSGTEPTWKGKTSPTTYAASEAPVYSSEKTVSVNGPGGSNGNGRTETWFCRRSSHRNSAEKGTASWQEFSQAFYQRHAETEKDYVPTVIAVRKAMTWKTEGLEIELNGEKWVGITCEVWEMKHRIDPKPLSNRVFTTIQVAASLSGTEETIFLQTPVSHFVHVPYSEYSKDKDVVLASYTAVERLRILPDAGKIEWIMATASDAGGVLPQFVQNLAVPGEITKDVRMFMDWISAHRTRVHAS